MKSLLPLILVASGIVLLCMSFLWPLLFPASQAWTEEKSERMTELQNDAHQLLFLAERAKTRPTAGGPSPSEARAKFKEAEAELEALRLEFEGIRDSPNTVGTYFRWAGTATTLLGGLAVLAGRNG